MVTVKCFSCGTLLTFPQTPGRRDECTKCHADVHCCKDCKFFDPTAYNECREPSADRVIEKDRANFCDFYQGNEGGVSAASKAADLRAAAEALFRKK